MNLTYEEFMNIVPKETAEFVDLALPYMERYLKEGRNIKFRRTDIESENYYSKVMVLLFYSLDQNKEYSSFLGKFGYESSRTKLEMENIPFSDPKSVMFEHHNSIFAIYEDKTLYSGLKPIDIMANAFRLYRSKCNTSLFSELFPRTSLDNFSSELESIRKKEKEELEQRLEKEVYGELPILIISYLETASKIRNLLFDYLKNRKLEIMNATEEDIVPLSLLLSLYYYKGGNGKDGEITDQAAVQEYLKEKGVTLEGINQILGFTLNTRGLNEIKKNIYAISKEYTKYFKDGINKDVDLANITLSSILLNLFNRNFTNSLVIEKIFAKLNCYVGGIINLDEEIEKAKQDKKHLYSLEYVKSFYSDLSKETRDFIDFTAKTYILLLEKMKKKEHNSKYLFNEDDADTLALYIATSIYGGDVDEFFKDHSVTLNKILKLLNLSITREEIEEVSLDHKVLVERYKRFVYDGINRGKYARNITINDISHNLCNREFNRTMILENMFDELTDEIDLKSDFLEQLKRHLDDKERERKRNLTQKLFHDMPAESIEYMEIVSKVHNWLKGSNIPYSEADIRSFSLLLSIFLIPDSDVKGFIESKGIKYDKVCSLLNISSKDRKNYSTDIDLLLEQYGVYIFGGANKDLNRKDLTVLNIAKNIFSKDLNNSVEISRFLSNFGLTYDFFGSFDDNYNKYLEETSEKRKEEEANNFVSSYKEQTREYIMNVLKIHNRIIKASESNDDVKSKIHNISDVIELSFILGLFTKDNDIRYFFEKNGLTLDNILSKLGLSKDILDNLRYDNFDYNLLLEQYKKIITTSGYSHNKIISDIAKRIFDPSFSKDSLILEELSSSLGADYEILKEEVETKRDHELSLTMDDRISLLSNSSVDDLNLDDIRSILHFGNSLSVHSKYIHDELPKLMLGDAHDRSIETINEIISRVYTKEEVVPKKKNFFAQLFALSIEEDKPKIVINPIAVEELKEAIGYNIGALSKELVGYDAIRKYIEVYRRKNRSHLLVASNEVTRMEEKVGSLNPHNEEEYADFLQATSHLQIMRDKVNRFNTSNHLMKQELLKVNQAIVNHFITINALEMARDDLFPLIGSELALSKGRETENQALDLSQNVMDLFQSLLTRNVDGAVENMEKLKQSSLPESVYQALNRDIETYLKGLNESKSMSQSIESLDIDSYTPTLTLDNSNAKQKVLINKK